MPRRWFIRLCFLLPIMLCVVAWAWSTCHLAEVAYSQSTTHATKSRCGLLWGEIFVSRWGDSNPRKSEAGWSVSADSRPFHIMDSDFIAPSRTSFFIAPSRTSFLGFGYGRGQWTRAGGTSVVRTACLPLWFPILLFSALLIPVWRKTRPARKARSFPVEPSAPEEPPAASAP